MNNLMSFVSTLENRSYPIFEPNQVLKNTDLNNLANYLDSQNRLTRAHTIGMGIVCGLDVSVQPNSGTPAIVLTAGYGITSEGYLLRYSPQTGDLFTHYQDSILDATTLNPEADRDLQLTMRELVRQGDFDSETDTPISTLDLGEQVLLVLCDFEDLPRDSCLIDCDDRGRDRNFNLRFFAIDRADPMVIVDPNDPQPTSADTLIRTGFEILPPTTTAAAFQQWFTVPDCHIPRLGYPTDASTTDFTIDLSTIQDFDDLMAVYYRACRMGIDAIATSFTQVEALFGPFLSSFQPDPTDFSAIAQQLTDLLFSLVPLSVALADPLYGSDVPSEPPKVEVGYGVQYFYDLLVELCAAFNELKQAIFDLMDDCELAANRFPKYLLLGEITPATDPCPRPSLYRHGFYQPPIYNGNRQRKAEIRHLYQRLQQMVASFCLLPFYQTPVKVTPSRLRLAPLADRSIPYFYDFSTVHPYWSYDACRKHQLDRLPAYFELATTASQTGYDLLERFDRSDFFAIEGHVGRTLDEALLAIDSFQQSFNLPFDVTAVRLLQDDSSDGETIPPTVLTGYFEDLEREFDLIRGRWQAMRAKGVGNVANTRLALIVSLIDQQFFFEGSSLSSLDPRLFENELLVRGRDRANYAFSSFRAAEGNFLSITVAAREAFVPTPPSGEGGVSFNNPYDFGRSLTEADRDRIIQTFADCFKHQPVTYDINSNDGLFRFAIRDGNVDIVVTGTDLNNFQVALEDETLFNSAFELIDRYTDWETLYAFLQFFGSGEEEAELLELVPYHEFRSLLRRYRDRLDIIQTLQTFPAYAEEHRGLEHLGGVPKQGTFVLVYTSDDEAISNLIVADVALRADSDAKVTALSTTIQLPPGKLDSGPERIAAIKDRIDKNVVVADFCLPYRCCTGFGNIDYVLAQPKPLISLDKAVFCEDDPGTYPFTLEPTGGILKGGDGIVGEAGQPAFQPSAIDFDVTEATNLTFVYVVDDVSATFSILMLPRADVTLTVAPNGPLCVTPGQPSNIILSGQPAGGTYRMAIAGGNFQDIQVDANGGFDLGAITYPASADTVQLQFEYIVPDTDDYCGNTSPTRVVEVVLAPTPQISYPSNSDGTVAGALVHGDICVPAVQANFSNVGSTADQYEWFVNGTPRANTRDAQLFFSYQSGLTQTVQLTATRQPSEGGAISCAATDGPISVTLPTLNTDWAFDNPDLAAGSVTHLCRTEGDSGPHIETITVQQAGGFFSTTAGLPFPQTNSELPCAAQTGYTLDYSTVAPGLYSLTYNLSGHPLGPNSTRQVRVQVVPVGSFQAGVLPVANGEAFELQFYNIFPTPEMLQNQGLQAVWEVTLTNADPFETASTRFNISYGDPNAIPGSTIQVVMRIFDADRRCSSVSAPEFVTVPEPVSQTPNPDFRMSSLPLRSSRLNPTTGGLIWDTIAILRPDQSNVVAIDFSQLRALNIEGFVRPDPIEPGSLVASVDFRMQPSNQASPRQSFNDAFPFDMYVDANDLPNEVWRPSPGTFTLRAIPFNASGGKGEPGIEMELKFALVEGSGGILIDGTKAATLPDSTSSTALDSATLASTETFTTTASLESASPETQLAAEVDYAAQLEQLGADYSGLSSRAPFTRAQTFIEAEADTSPEDLAQLYWELGQSLRRSFLNAGAEYREFLDRIRAICTGSLLQRLDLSDLSADTLQQLQTQFEDLDSVGMAEPADLAEALASAL
ncbi:hypothetical protein [Synechococcus sp. PCC 7336]|uniref:hypothetical protein n=1 Tax=Synechococcus sp. PCC 7336 TaxID=195250 RepID=UPI00037A89A0|nr:hypothetical protein [Synechococcus sp. PCC 7336]